MGILIYQKIDSSAQAKTNQKRLTEFTEFTPRVPQLLIGIY